MTETAASALKRAAQYLRMSTDIQYLSIALQTRANAAYALEHDYEIVATYIDPGESGITIDKRVGLQKLLADVVARSPDFEAILVHDVSRWGRFQDPDEAAHYEFICRAAGVRVIYTTESFRDDNSLASTLVKQLKRVAAAEFSRDLSDKVRRIQWHLFTEGFHRGGPPPYGIQRQQVGLDGRPHKVMAVGERKNFRASRTLLVPGPPEEVAVVRRIFRTFVERQRTTAQIATDLNGRHLTTRLGCPWNAARVREVLKNEIHMGTYVLGKERFYLGRRQSKAPRGEWRRAPGALPAIITRTRWKKADTYLALKRYRYVSNERLLADLRSLRARHGRMSAEIIAAGGGHAVGLYKLRFGSLTEAYIQAGFGQTESERRAKLRKRRPTESYRRNAPIGSDEQVLLQLRRVFLREGRLTNRIVNEAPDCPCVPAFNLRFGGMRLAYALAGYRPTPYQDLQMEAHGQSVTSQRAQSVCEAVRRADRSPAEIWRDIRAEIV